MRERKKGSSDLQILLIGWECFKQKIMTTVRLSVETIQHSLSLFLSSKLSLNIPAFVMALNSFIIAEKFQKTKKKKYPKSQSRNI